MLIVLKSLNEDQLREKLLALAEKYKASVSGKLFKAGINGLRLIGLREEEFKDLGLPVYKYLKVVSCV